jgi:hypothetical protein
VIYILSTMYPVKQVVIYLLSTMYPVKHRTKQISQKGAPTSTKFDCLKIHHVHVHIMISHLVVIPIHQNINHYLFYRM